MHRSGHGISLPLRGSRSEVPLTRHFRRELQCRKRKDAAPGLALRPPKQHQLSLGASGSLSLRHVEQLDHPHLPSHIETDVKAIRKNYITLTPLHYNLTDAAGIYELQERNFKL